MMLEPSIEQFSLLHGALLIFLITVAVAIVGVRHLLAAIILLAVYSLLMALMYLTLGAPDVAMTEAAIGAGISTLLLLAALLLTGKKEGPMRHKPLPLLAVCALGMLLLYAMNGLPSFGDPQAAANLRTVPYYLSHALEETHAHNVVTAILASYRGFDTLGELFVIFTAGIGVLALLEGRKESD